MESFRLILNNLKNQSNITGMKLSIYTDLEPRIIEEYPDEIDWIAYLSCCQKLTRETILFAVDRIGDVSYFYLSANRNLTDDLKLEFKNYLTDLDLP